MRTDAQQGIVLNVVVGVVGAFLGNIIAAMFHSASSLGVFDLTGLIWSFVGAIILLAIINLVRRGSVR
ncbi:MAG TPA: GlsB/YeaQ/YmgE family stress response membrane protein [Sphingopyxis sp.]|nr:GlsB/YeaQ/YmgE family stress response membrane protein [Sphingopyxis sp.]